MKIKASGISFFLVLLTLAGCGSSEGLQSNNLAYLYNAKEVSLRAHYVIEHLSDTVSRAYYRFNSADLLYVRNNQNNLYEAEFAITYKLHKSFNDVVALDSNSFSFKDKVEQPPQKVITGYFDFKTKAQNLVDQQGLLVIELLDLKRKVSYQNVQRFTKQTLNNRQFFRLTDTSKRILFKPHIAAGAPFKLSHPILEPKYFYVSVYQREFPLALPPYSSKRQNSFELKPDTTYKILANEPILLPHAGFFHFRLDTTQWEGYTVYSFYEEFPYIANRVHLAPPLRYLTTSKEYSALEANLNNPEKVKKTVDEFWLSRAGSAERSRVLLKTYYERIQEANQLFTSFVEGWQTDRGIIYTIYGPPNIVYQSKVGESWVYGSENSSLSYYFTFEKVVNPFTNNDYELLRSAQYRYGWGQAIEAWRNGHVYNSKDIRREQDAQDQQLQYRNRNPYWY
jgi:GWxTD domain-containing protein